MEACTKTTNQERHYIGFDWKSGESTVFVFVAFYGSTEDAANGLKNLPSFFEDGGLRMTVLPTTIPNLGDENYTWKDCCDKRFTGVDFRKGKVVVHVNAPSIEIAQRFASHVAAALTVNTSSITSNFIPLPVCNSDVSGPQESPRSGRTGNGPIAGCQQNIQEMNLASPFTTEQI